MKVRDDYLRKCKYCGKTMDIEHMGMTPDEWWCCMDCKHDMNLCSCNKCHGYFPIAEMVEENICKYCKR